MNLLVLQLKRIGDLILTTPALVALRRALPEARITLVIAGGGAALAPALDFVDEVLVVRGGGAEVARSLVLRRFEACLDFTGSDRSALFTVLSKARRRVAFSWVKKSRVRALAYNRFADSPVRDAHTVDHYLHLLKPLQEDLGGSDEQWAGGGDPVLHLPEEVRARAAAVLEEMRVGGPFVIIHPGSARPEKYWEPAAWIQLVRYLREGAGMNCVLTGGDDIFEKGHLAAIAGANVKVPAKAGVGRFVSVAGWLDLLTFAALVERARLVVSCDTAIVHLAAAFRTPQVALFGPTNPFHWHPRHERAVVLSAAHPEGPLREFDPQMKGAPMRHLSTECVIRATAALLSES